MIVYIVYTIFCTVLCSSYFYQIFANVVSDDVIAVTRHCPASHKSIVMVAHTAFRAPHYEATPTHSNRYPNHCFIPPMSVPGKVDHMTI